MDSENQTDVEWSAVLKCWSRRTKTEKASIIFGLLLLFLVATVVISLNSTPYFVARRYSGIEHAASSVLEDIEFSVDPCIDFYQFACGKYMNQTKIPDGRQSVTRFTVLNDKVQEKLRSLISENIDESDPAPFNLAKNLYKKCRNTPIHNSLDDIKIKFDGWSKEESNEQNWIEIIKAYRNLGYETESILGVGIGTDLKNSTSKILTISQPNFGIDHKYLLIGLYSEVVWKYYYRMVSFAGFFGRNCTETDDLMKESLDFEMELAKISLPIEKLRDRSTLYNLLTLREMQEKYTYIEWTEYINALLPLPLSVDENEIVMVETPSFFENLGVLLNKTPPHVISNYVKWRAIDTNEKLIYMRVQQNEIKCIGIVGRNFPVSVSAMYVRKNLHQNWREAASRMVNGIRHEFELILKNADWMDEETRKMALRKLGAMFTHIGYPDMLMDDTKIEEYYKNLEMDESTFISSILSIKKFDINREFIKLNKPVEKDDWNMEISPFGISPGYLINENGIQIPAAILQEPFFSFDRPWYMNFASIGSIIGHEIIHGFDDIGAQFDLGGKLYDWWKPETKAKYLQRTKCIIEQYGNYKDDSTGLKINGINTQGENIADTVGFRASYLAYQKWEKENGIEPRLPGLNYTKQQLYWISAAQTWCSVSTTEHMNDFITTNEHSPDRFRVIGPFRNSKEFARDFQCPAGSRMNPVKKCDVW